MIIEKVTTLKDIVDAEGNVTGQTEAYYYKIYDLEEAETDVGETVTIKVLRHTVSEAVLLKRYNTAKARRDEALAEMNKLKAYWDQIQLL